MAVIEGFFDAFYSRFVLRDLFAKIVAGMLLLTAIWVVAGDSCDLGHVLRRLVGDHLARSLSRGLASAAKPLYAVSEASLR